MTIDRIDREQSIYLEFVDDGLVFWNIFLNGDEKVSINSVVKTGGLGFSITAHDNHDNPKQNNCAEIPVEDHSASSDIYEFFNN